MRDPLDRLFGGAPGAASKARQGMKRTYGAEDGEIMFKATVIKRRRKSSAKRTLAQRLLGK